MSDEGFDELEMKGPVPVILEQFVCPGCEKKFYVNQDDLIEEFNVLDCPFCDVSGVKHVRRMNLEIKKVQQKIE